VATSLAASLGIADASSVQVTGVQPVLATELAAAGASRRRRLQPGSASVVGYRVLISIRASAAAASPALAAAVSSGASLSGAVTSAVTSAVSGGSLVQAIAAASPASVAALGYTSAAAMAAGTTVDPTRPAALVAAATAAAASGDGATSSGISGGGVAGIVIAALVAAAVAYTVRSYRNTGRLPFSSAPRRETSSQKLGEATAAALDHVSPVVVAGARGKDAGVTIRQFESAAPRPERFAAHPSGTSV